MLHLSNFPLPSILLLWFITIVTSRLLLVLEHHHQSFSVFVDAQQSSSDSVDLSFTDFQFPLGVLPTVFYNGTIYTVSQSLSTTPAYVDAMLVNIDGMIEVMGTYESVIAMISPSSSYQYFNLKQRLVLPGFHDVHLHAVEAGINEQLCYIEPDTPARNLASVIQACQRDASSYIQLDNDWIMAAGVDIGLLMETIVTNVNAELPITVLDRAYPNTPIVIIDSIGHGAVVNTAAIHRVKQSNPDFETDYGGKVLRDADTMDYYGIVTESTQQIFRSTAFNSQSTTHQQIAYDSLLTALQTMNANGITSVSDAGGYWQQAQTESWSRALLENKLTVRASNALYIYPDIDINVQLPMLLPLYTNDASSRLRFNQAKIYVDGILELTTAALYEPYLSSLQLPTNEQYGFEYFGTNKTVLQTVVAKLANAGFQIHFHVVGDRAVGMALDAIELAMNQSAIARTSGPHRLTHLYMVDDRDKFRFAQLGVVADFQLAPSSVDLEYRNFLSTDLIGSTRANRILPATELYYDTDALITLSSDWDADVLSPLLKIQTVLTRPDGRSFQNVAEVIPMLTINGATLLRQNNQTGSLEPGKYADFVVLDKNIFDLPPSEIGSTKIMLTVLQGQLVYNGTSNSGFTFTSGGPVNIVTCNVLMLMGWLMVQIL